MEAEREKLYLYHLSFCAAHLLSRSLDAWKVTEELPVYKIAGFPLFVSSFCIVRETYLQRYS